MTPSHEVVKEAIHGLLATQDELCYTFQLLREFWTVATRPTDVNGYGLTPAQARLVLDNVEGLFTYLPNTESIRDEWLALVTDYQVSGKNAHDAGHVAAMRAHGITRILSLDERDFSRYADIDVVRPHDAIRDAR